MSAERECGFGALLLMEFDRAFIRPALHRRPGGHTSRGPALNRGIAPPLFRPCLGNGYCPRLRDFIFRQIGQKLPAWRPYRRKNGDQLWIGKECNIGANSIIMAGIRVGDNCVVAAASVVMKDVPPNCLVAGNPARIMEKGIRTGPRGIIDRTVRADFGTASSVPDDKAPENAAS
jgi:hypothetical protein